VQVRSTFGAVGRVLAAVGVLLLLFVAYQLWGTGLLEARHQAALRQEFTVELRHVPRPTGATTTAPGATTSTMPASEPVPGVAPPDGQPVGLIQIPKINVDKVVVEGTATADLQLGPGHYPGTPLPGQNGNAAIAGHRTTYGAPFYSLSQLVPGDAIYVTTLQGRFHYSVTDLLRRSPSDTSAVANTNFAELTLTTCDPPFSAANRLIVQGRLIGRAALAPPPPTTTAKSGGPSVLTRKVAVSKQVLVGGDASWAAVVGWGSACVAFGIGVWLLARRRRRRRRLAVYGASVPVFVIGLFFFQVVSPFVPASF